MRQDGVFFTKKAIIDFIGGYAKGSNTKDYEFIAALALRYFCEEQWGGRVLSWF